MEIFKLFGSIFVNNEDANKSISKTEEKAKGLGEKMGEGIKTAAKWGAGIVAGAGAAVTAVIALANKTAESADEIDKMAERTGIGRERLQELRYAAGQSDVEFSVLEKAVKKMSEATMSAADGNKKATEAFKALGIELYNTDGSLKSTNQLFEESMSALADMEEGVQRNVLGNQLFGKGYTEMLPLLNAGSEGIKELSDRSRELGLVMSEDAVVANVVFGDTMSDLKQSFSSVFMHLSNQFLPILQIFINFILEHMPLIQEVIGTVFGFVSKVAEIAIEWIKKSLDMFNNWFNGTMEGSDKFMQYFEIFKEWFIDLFNLIVELVKASLESIKAFWDKHGEAIIAVAKSIWDIIKVVIDTAMKVIKDIIKVVTALIKGDWEGVWEGIKSIVATVWEAIKDLVRLGIEGIKNIINLAWDVLKSAFDKLWTSVSDWFMGLIDDALEWGKNVVEGLWNGISNMAGWIGDKIKEFAKGIADGFKNFFGIKSPSTLMAEYGKNIDEGLAKGIEENQHKPLGAITAVGEKMASTAKNIANSILDMLSIDMSKGTYSLGNVSYNSKSENQRYQDKKQKDLKENDNEIKDIAKRQGVDLSVAYDMWQQNELDKLMNKVPKYAQGTNFHPGGLAIVGEKGPELLNLPRGSQVTPLDKAGINIIIQEPRLFREEDADYWGEMIVSRLKSLGVVTS